MKAMIASDLVTMKSSLAQLAIMCVLVAVVMAAMAQSLVVCAAAFCAMIPFMYLFTISAYDEMNGWERLRLTLPISRTQVVCGRYVSLLVVAALCDIAALVFAIITMAVVGMLPAEMRVPGLAAEANGAPLLIGVIVRVSALILFVAALTLPFFMRYGMTKGTRIAPVALILLFSFGLWAASESGLSQPMESLFLHTDGPSLVLTFAILGGSFVAYALSALISSKLYQKRQF